VCERRESKCVCFRERVRECEGEIIYQSKRDLSESGYEIELTRRHLNGTFNLL